MPWCSYVQTKRRACTKSDVNGSDRYSGEYSLVYMDARFADAAPSVISGA